MAHSTSMVLEDSSVGDAVSGRGEDEFDEDEDLYYIPERRPSLDLGPTPMDTSQWYFVDQALTPAQSYETLSSEKPDEMTEEEEPPKQEKEESPTRVHLERTDSFSSCYSIDSDDCEKIIPTTKTREEAPEISNELQLIQGPEEIKHPSLTLKFTFEALCETLKKLPNEDFGEFKFKLWTHYPQPFSSSRTMDIVDLVDRLLESFSCEMSVQITRTILVAMRMSKTADFLRLLCIKNEVRYELAEELKRRFSEEPITEGVTMPLDDIYTDFRIYDKTHNGPNTEHEIREMGNLNAKRTPDKQLTLAESFSPEKVNKFCAFEMIMFGMVGSGKSVFVKKLALDWALGRSHQHFSFVYLLTFRELKQFQDKQISLEEIIFTFYPMARKLKTEGLRFDDSEALFIFDGIDEYDEKLDYYDTVIFSDPSEASTLNVMLVNLIRGRLLYKARTLLTTRPHAYPFYPWDGHFSVSEMCYFSDANKEDYFKKRFKDANRATTVIEYVKSMKTLHIMCHLPLFCSLVAEECERIFREMGTRAKLPRNITYMYTKLLLTILRPPRKRGPDLSPEEQQTFLTELGKCALTMLEKNQFRILRKQWPKTCPLPPAVKGGLCTQFTICPSVLYYEEMVAFLHPTVQEYLAALYAYLTFRNQDKIVFEQHVKSKFKMSTKGHKIMELYKAAVEKSLQCDDGKLDMFLRFLFGMTCKTNQELLLPFLKPSAKLLDLTKDCAALIKKNQGTPNPDRSRNLLRCLEELEI